MLKVVGRMEVRSELKGESRRECPGVSYVSSFISELSGLPVWEGKNNSREKGL